MYDDSKYIWVALEINNQEIFTNTHINVISDIEKVPWSAIERYEAPNLWYGTLEFVPMTVTGHTLSNPVVFRPDRYSSGVSKTL